MMKKELKKKLIDKLSIHLQQIGFDKKAVGQTFWKPTKNGKLAIHLSYIDHPDNLDITLDLAVRIDELEDLKNSLRPNLKQSEKKQTATIGVEFGNFTMGSQKRWTVATQSDVDTVAMDLYNCIVETGNSYFEKYSNLETILSVCQKDDEIGRLHSPINHVRAINAVGAAKILNNPNLKELIKLKEEYLLSTGDFGLSEYKEFVRLIS